MERGLILAGNWKMNKGPAETTAFLQDLQKSLTGYSQGKEAIRAGKVEVLFFPTFISLPSTCSLREQCDALWDFGAQNCHWETSGAFTGEISVGMLKETGCHSVIIGHSERRHIFGESDDFMEKKIRSVLEEGLRPILCVGETLDERESGQAFTVIDRQLISALKELTTNQIATNMVIAYEPVWAIGTGKTASDADAQEVCRHIRTVISEHFGNEAAEAVRILYGGSVKPSNAKGLLDQPDIDGALIGGAALKVDSFMGIFKACISE